MKKFICDFCGNEIKEEDLNDISISVNSNSFDYDLCAICCYTLYKFLDKSVYDDANKILADEE